MLRLVAEGKTSKDIAVLLDLGLQTVRSYRKTMMKKLGVNNVAGLTQVALAAGLTQWRPPGEDPSAACGVPGVTSGLRCARPFSLARISSRPWARRARDWQMPPEDPARLARDLGE